MNDMAATLQDAALRIMRQDGFKGTVHVRPESVKIETHGGARTPTAVLEATYKGTTVLYSLRLIRWSTLRLKRLPTAA